MKKEAEQFAEEDRKKKENIETVNNAETLIYTVEKTISDSGDKIDQSSKEDLQKLIGDLKKLIEEKKYDEIKAKQDELAKKIQEIGAKFYQTSQETAQTQGSEEQAVIDIPCFLPEPLSWAETFRIPLASISNVTSICGIPFGAGGIPTRLNIPSETLSDASGLSP